MKKIRLSRCDRYLIGASEELAPERVQILTAMLDSPERTERLPLGGRGVMIRADVEGIGRVVIKPYKRGGFLRILNDSWYVRWGALRPSVEFELLQRVRELGIHAPEPIAFLVRGGLLYKGWLVTKEIPNQQTLAEISLQDEERLARIMQRFVAEVRLLVQHGIYHVDLHPGNVLVDDQDAVYLLDFDKARVFGRSKNQLRDRYLCRWRRAVIKHNLPEVLSELLCVELRTNYERT